MATSAWPYKYSLWLAPSEPAASTLSAIINRMSAEVEGASAPFAPHVTLVPCAATDLATVLSQTEALAAAIAPIDAVVRGAQAGTFYFQCVFCRCEDSEALTRANALGQSAMLGAVTSAYMPHASLLYADLGEEEKAALAEREDAGVRGMALPLTRLQVWETSTSDVGAWVMKAEYPLTGPAA